MEMIVRELALQRFYNDGVSKVLFVGALSCREVYALFLWLLCLLLEYIRSYEKRALRCSTVIAL